MGTSPSNSRARARLWPYRRYRHYQKELQQVAARWFRDRGCAVSSRYPYILEKREDWPRNMIEREVAAYVKGLLAERSPEDAFPLHKYVHHGLSSQAALFNLVVPMVRRNGLGPLQQALEASGCVWPSGAKVEFEHEDRETLGEDAGQPTSVDLRVTGDDGSALFIESKLTESEFGGCSVFACGDCDGRNPAAAPADCYLHFIGRHYWSLLGKHGFLEGPVGRDYTCALSCHYQFFREFVFALEHQGTFVLLYDDRNPTFYSVHPEDRTRLRGLMPLLEGLVPDHLKDRLARVSYRAVLEAAAARAVHHEWVVGFRSKYGL